jgi:DNA-binding protein HU-beta
MNRTDIVNALVASHDLSRKDAVAVYRTFFDAEDGLFAKALKKGDKVSLTGFGTFGLRKRAARMGRNPQTGEKVKIAASKAPAFKAGASLKAFVNGKTVTKAAPKKAAKKGARKTAKKGARK